MVVNFSAEDDRVGIEVIQLAAQEHHFSDPRDGNPVIKLF